MRSRRSRQFRKDFESLPADVRKRAKAAYQLFLRDPFHPSLFFKLIHAEKQVYSVRIGLHHRALGVRRGDEVLWFWIGTHAEYNKVIEHL